jgi:hypothetical protein
MRQIAVSAATETRRFEITVAQSIRPLSIGARPAAPRSPLFRTRDGKVDKPYCMLCLGHQRPEARNDHARRSAGGYFARGLIEHWIAGRWQSWLGGTAGNGSLDRARRFIVGNHDQARAVRHDPTVLSI